MIQGGDDADTFVCLRAHAADYGFRAGPDHVFNADFIAFSNVDVYARSNADSVVDALMEALAQCKRRLRRQQLLTSIASKETSYVTQDDLQLLWLVQWDEKDDGWLRRLFQW
jgi:hypothetical protein